MTILENSTQLAKLLDEIEYGATGVTAAELLAIDDNPIHELLNKAQNIIEETLPNSREVNPALAVQAEQALAQTQLEIQQVWDRLSPGLVDAIAKLKAQESSGDSIAKDAKGKITKLEVLSGRVVKYGDVPRTVRGLEGTLTVREPREHPRAEDPYDVVNYFVTKALLSNPELSLTEELLNSPPYDWTRSVIEEAVRTTMEVCGAVKSGPTTEYVEWLSGDLTGKEREEHLERQGVTIFSKDSFQFRAKK